MAKKITLTNPHAQNPAATEYKLKKLLVQYDTGTAVVILEDENGRGFSVGVNSIPATTQEQAILALINNGVLAGTIGNV